MIRCNTCQMSFANDDELVLDEVEGVFTCPSCGSDYIVDENEIDIECLEDL